MSRRTEEILSQLENFQPHLGNWRRLDELLAELWEAGVTKQALPSLFAIFERFPDDDGAEVFWSIVHGIESLDLDYETALRDSLARKRSFMGTVMLDRLERSKRT